MGMGAADFYEASLSLPPSVRKDVALRMLESVEVIDDDPIQDEWTSEIGSRVDDILSGNVATIPTEEVFVKLATRRAERQTAHHA
ncbi:MAG: addiction module protein [Propionibacteriaceae bacterium]|nr:addiction module protein [Propionibacteriaceae bacterium]